eukprot:403334861
MQMYQTAMRSQTPILGGRQISDNYTIQQKQQFVDKIMRVPNKQNTLTQGARKYTNNNFNEMQVNFNGHQRASQTRDNSPINNYLRARRQSDKSQHSQQNSVIQRQQQVQHPYNYQKFIDFQVSSAPTKVLKKVKLTQNAHKNQFQSTLPPQFEMGTKDDRFQHPQYHKPVIAQLSSLSQDAQIQPQIIITQHHSPTQSNLNIQSFRSNNLDENIDVPMISPHRRSSNNIDAMMQQSVILYPQNPQNKTTNSLNYQSLSQPCWCQQQKTRTNNVQIQTEVMINNSNIPISFTDIDLTNHNDVLKSYFKLQIDYTSMKTQFEGKINSMSSEIGALQRDKAQLKQKYSRKKQEITSNNKAYKETIEKLEASQKFIKANDRLQSPIDSLVQELQKNMTMYSNNPSDYGSIIDPQRFNKSNDKSNMNMTTISTIQPNHIKIQQKKISTENETQNLKQRSNTIGLVGANNQESQTLNTLSLPKSDIKKVNTFLPKSGFRSKSQITNQNQEMTNKNITTNQSISYDRTQSILSKKYIDKSILIVEVDGESQSSQMTSVHKHTTMKTGNVNREKLDLSMIDESKGNRRLNTNGGHLNKLLTQQTLKNIPGGQTLSKQETITIRDRLTESELGSRGRFTSEDDEAIAYTQIVKVITQLKHVDYTLRELLQEKLYDYETVDQSLYEAEYILVDDFFMILSQTLKIDIKFDQKDKFKKVFAEKYKQGNHIHNILDYNKLEQIFNILEADTLYSYTFKNKNLKFLDNKSYRILNRMNKHIKEHFNGNFDDFLNPISSSFIITISKTMRQGFAVKEAVFLDYLVQLGIRKSSKPVDAFMSNFRSGTSKDSIINFGKIKNYIKLCDQCEYIKLISTRKRRPQKQSSNVKTELHHHEIQEVQEDANSFKSENFEDNVYVNEDKN